MTAMHSASLAQRGAWARYQADAGARQLSRPSAAFLYRYRNLVERFFNKLKHYRAIATRFEKHDANYLALVKLAAAKIWILVCMEIGDLVIWN